jgi:hypothetical protein
MRLYSLMNWGTVRTALVAPVSGVVLGPVPGLQVTFGRYQVGLVAALLDREGLYRESGIGRTLGIGGIGEIWTGTASTGVAEATTRLPARMTPRATRVSTSRSRVPSSSANP